MADPSAENVGALRREADAAIERQDALPAQGLLRSLWSQRRDAATAAYVVSRYEKIRQALPLTRCRLAILRSFTLEPIVPLLRAMAFTAGIDLEVQIGDFGTYFQETVDPASSLYSFAADVVILAVQTRDIAPDLWEQFADLAPGDVAEAVHRTVERFRQMVAAFRERSKAPLIMHLLERPTWAAQGVLDRQLEMGQAAAIESINREVMALARQSRNVYTLEYESLPARRGHQGWFDPRMWLVARLPISAGGLMDLAEEWMRFLHPILGRTCKALVVDLDNTLWGGVIGEDGISGIQLADGYPAAGFRALQRAMLDLYRRGILLAVCSKNNPADAREAIEKHPGMLLRAEHFAAMRIDWNDKASNLRAIATELNIGIGALAFLDDNPVERAWVRSQLPEVTVIDLPADPMGYAAALRRCPAFERLEVSEEDRARGRYYAEQRLRTELQQSAGSLEDFYRSLQMKVRVAPVTPQTLTRAAQLTQKTNQFNLTTRRYTEEQLASLIASGGWLIRTVSVADRFGDNGIVGLVMARMEGDACRIDNFLLSCRVIGRTVETALLAAVADEARQAGAHRLLGSFIPTKKNAPAREFYASHGFHLVGEDGAESRWELDIVTRPVMCPPWLECRIVKRPGPAAEA